MARVEAFRRAHDPMHARIAAHLTLVFPAPQPRAVRRRLAAALAAVPRFRVALGGAGSYPDGSVHLRVTAGASAISDLHRSLTAALGIATPRSAPAYRPHVTVASAATAALARRLVGAAAAIGPIEFGGRAVSLVQESRAGRWREVARHHLGAPAARRRTPILRG